MQAGLGRFFFLILSVLFVGCTNNKSDIVSPESIAGAYYTEKIDSENHYEPETHYVLDDKGQFIVTYIYEITDSQGNSLAYREVHIGSYSVSGSKMTVRDFRGLSVCKDTKKNRKPLNFEVNFRKEGVNLILIDGDQSLTLRLASSSRLEKYETAKLCADLNLTSERVNEIELNPADSKSPKSDPPVAGVDDVPGGSPGATQTKFVGLPPQISPVIVRPPSKGKNPDLVPYIEFENESWVERVVGAAKIECLDKKECPAFVGLFIGKKRTDKIQMHQCSTTYLGDGYFSTNSHCYHRSISKLSTSYVQNCSNEIWVKMPETDGFEAQTLNCDKVIYLTRMVPRTLYDDSKDGHQGREAFDVMIFKVKEPVNRPKAVIDFASLVEVGEELTAWTVNPTQDKPGINGVIEKKTCRAYDYNNKSEFFKLDEKLSDSIYRAVHINSCDKMMVKGNSGSTLFNSKSQGVAVFSHIYIENDDEAFSKRGYGTKYTCLGDVVDGEKNVFRGVNESRCRTLGIDDLAAIRENLRIREHNSVVADVKKLLDVLRGKIDDLRHQASNSKSVDPLFSPKRDSFKSSIDAVSFGNSVWVSDFRSFRPSPLFTYTTSKRYDEENFGLVSEDGKIILDSFKKYTSDGFINMSDNFSTYVLRIPSCVHLDKEKLSRRRTDNRFNPFEEVRYEYDEVRINLPMDTFIIDYEYEPREITDGNIDTVRLNTTDVRSSTLPFSVYLTIDKYGFLSEVKFDPAQDLRSNRLVEKIYKAVEGYCQ